MATKLYIGNLPFKVREEDLQALFQQAGTVESVSIIRDKFSGQSRGFGFIEMDSPDSGQKAIEMFNGHSLENRQIIVNEARPQTPRPPRSGGGGGGGGRGGYGRHDR
ncbi:MAG TPA: RNA-binding protein [Candidatus Acidoferrales bacterium]|nr:RNA-binding protein [Candidatus Acidoferrales bacterium]